MRRKLLLLNLVLLALVAAAAWRLRVNWLAGRAEEQKPPLPGEAGRGRGPGTRTASPTRQRGRLRRRRAEGALCQRPESEGDGGGGARQADAAPAAGLRGDGHGQRARGDSERKAGGVNRGYSLGEKVGDFTLVAVEDDEFVFDWEGQEIRKKLLELRPQPGTPAPQAATAAAAASPGAVVQSVAALADAGPGPRGDRRIAGLRAR